MFGRRFELFRLFGIAIRVDVSWFIIAILITWSLAQAFPRFYSGLSPATYWGMAASGALGLFASILLHECSHALAARRFGVPIRGITLFIFGGVAEMEDEPQNPKAEFVVAIAGPIVSILIGLLGLFGWAVARSAGWPTPIEGVLGYLGLINGVLVAFNLVPAFPLDGGRVLRSALWHWKGSLRWATRIASQIGSGFGFVLIGLGVFWVLRGDFIGGMWWFLIGLFLRNAAQMGYQQVLMRRALEGEVVRHFMKTDPVVISPDIPIARLVEDYVYRHHHKMFPVVDGDRLLGYVTTRDVKEVPREEWAQRMVRDIVEPATTENTVGPDADALRALATMSRTGASRLLVVEDGRLLGVLTLKDMLKFLALRVELGEEDGA
ncbi:MAG: M50 family metallopeptidase [Gemmatimonadota bacterium]